MRRRRGTVRSLGVRELAQRQRGSYLPLSTWFIPCRSSPPFDPPCRRASSTVGLGSHPHAVQPPWARTLAISHGARRLPPAASVPGSASPPSSPSSPPVRCPGAGRWAPVSLIGVSRPARCRDSQGVVRRRSSAAATSLPSAATASRLATQVLRCIHLTPTKARNQARTSRLGAGRKRGV